jgi:hypothetical protein
MRLFHKKNNLKFQRIISKHFLEWQKGTQEKMQIQMFYQKVHKWFQTASTKTVL